MTTLDDADERRLRELRDQIFAYLTKPDDGRLFEPLTLIESVLRTVQEEATEAAAKKWRARAENAEQILNAVLNMDKMSDEQLAEFKRNAEIVRELPSD